MITAYAVTAHPAPALPDHLRLRLVASDGLAAACGPAEASEPSADALWRHEAVVEALMADRDVVPLRYGTRFPDESSAAAAIAERREELSGALARVRGAVEIAVRIATTDEPPDASEPHSARDYLRAKARVAELRQEAARLVHDPLASRVRMSTQRPTARFPELLRCAYLVDRAAVQGFLDAAAERDSATARFSVLCTGPWPPYSFVGS